MDYTINENTQDKKIATAVFNRFFGSFKHLKEDMIQLAIIDMWQARQNSFYIRCTTTYLSKTAHNAMLNFVKRKCHYINAETFSLFDEIVDGLIIADIIADKPEYEPENILAFKILQKQVDEVLDTFNEKGRMIIRMYLNHRSLFEIGKCFGMSKNCVHKYVLKFRDAVSKKIDERKVA